MNLPLLTRAIQLAREHGHHNTAQALLDMVTGYRHVITHPLPLAHPMEASRCHVFEQPRTLREVPPRLYAQAVFRGERVEGGK